MLRILMMAIVVVGFAATANAEVTVKSTNPEDHRLAVSAVDSVVDYFESIGYDTKNINFSIVFGDSVRVDVADVNNENKSKREVSGFYDAKTREINVFSFAYKREGRMPWGLPWSKEIAYSILQHEITHAIVHHVMGSDLEKLDRIWNEYVAYGVQFAVMDSDLRNRVLNGPKKTDSFVDNPLVVNFMVYGADPDNFSIMVHNTLQKGLYLIKDTIDSPPAGLSLEMFLRF